ncbi:pyridoxal phosphate-dependent aminotransferase [Facklamia sp. DSM 111018]|uniref:cysteine-S-conjugate beta-lyase n=1 Tax=Facklamia lactis TaxID=2749967 RepID=A0ABS0LSB3_9LACT|nr:MalY/PatB family protein [Facklamia lactis]MBG9981253.1 pyridoxal phosphate-dependent aminotransferase [Facklamia lactis]MBG9987055.1 pyridoxal phosphate-dependent aminotransferase [Facklamia lactis]
MKHDFQTCVDRTDQGSKKWRLMRESKENIGENVAPLSIADLDFPMAPGIVEGLKEELDRFIMGYTVPTKEYLESVKNWMKTQHNWEVEEDWLVTAPGVVPAINVFVNAFTEEGDGVIILEPVYNPFSETIKNHHREVMAVDLVNEQGEYSIDFDALEAVAKDEKSKAMIFCSPHNPLGRVWTKEELERVAQICMDNQLYLFSDEIHFDLAHKDYQHHVFASLSPEIAQHVVVATAPSKTFNLAGLQTSNIFIPNSEWRERYSETADRLDLKSVPALGLLACQYAYNTSLEWKEELVELIYHNYLVAKEIIERELPKGIVTPMQASYLLWLDLREYDLSCEEIAKISEENDVFLNNGQMFGKCGECFVRIHLAVPTKVIEAAVKRFCQGINNYS